MKGTLIGLLTTKIAFESLPYEERRAFIDLKAIEKLLTSFIY